MERTDGDQDTGRDIMVAVHPLTVNLGWKVRRLCGDRFARVGVPLPERTCVYRVYRTRQSWSEKIACSAAELRQWTEALETCTAGLIRALLRLHRRHGGTREAEIALDWNTGRFMEPGLPRVRLPGWSARNTVRSEKAQRAYLAEVTAVTEAYRPVAEEIERRVERKRAARRAVEAERRRAAERLAAAVREVGAQPVWCYTVAAGAGPVVDVRRCDVDPGTGGPEESPLTAYELDARLRELVGERAGRRVRWDRAACVRTEEDLAARGERLSFVSWWQTVTGGWWETRLASGAPVSVVHVSSYPTGYGAGGHGGGGHSCGGGHGCGGF
ncbi:hypothetical protein [Streptomyces sp. NPDC090022]|uniref:hypothetical protein n=1 Tax=Streptomyces sp. NPDC090022 TaxID=3365920 RepID=UPI00380B86FF